LAVYFLFVCKPMRDVYVTNGCSRPRACLASDISVNCGTEN